MKKVKLSINPLTITAMLTGIAVGLMIGGFFTPPLAEIDGSVLTGSGILFAFAALWTTIYSLARGADVTIKHKDVEVTIDNEPDKN